MKNIASSLQHLLLPLCLSATALLAGPAFAHASGTAQARISAEISSSQMAALPSSQIAGARPEFDQGRLAGNTRMQGITMYFSRTQAQQADLTQLLVAQQNPASPQFHQWLTPEQFGARFGLADADISKVESWLEQQGFSIDEVGRSKNYVRFSGTATQVERAFSTEMHNYRTTYNGKVEKHIAPSTALSVPSALAGVVLGIRNLNDFRPHAHVLANHRVAAKPRFTWDSTNGNYVFFAPGDLDIQYDLQATQKSGYTGVGQSIALIGQSDILASDIEAFQTASGLPIKDPTKYLVPGSGNEGTYVQGDESESDIDIEWSGAIATGATIKFVFSGSNTNYGAFDALLYAIAENVAPIISSSYGTCETQFANDQADLNTLEAGLQQAASQGQSVMSAAGDDGSTDCFGESSLQTAQQEALAVDYPGSSAYVTSVGGLQVSSTNSAYLTAGSAYWSSSTGASTSLLQPVPEVVWNEDQLNIQNGCNPDQTDCLSSGGGGASALFSKPSWQTGVPGIPSDSKRDVPDIALQASTSDPGYVFCTSDTSFWISGQQNSCNNGYLDSVSTYPTVAGGTSFAAPIFAGMVAILNQQHGYSTGQGLVNPTLYKLASNATTYASAFHDITSGNNDCLGSSVQCNGNPGFSATTGYDQASGLGSVDLGNLTAAWPASTGTALIATTTTISATNTAPVVNTSDTFTVTVVSASGSTLPTGDVTIDVDGGTSNGGVTSTGNALASNGTVTYTYTFTSAGTHSVVATYQGDTTHASSSSSVSVNVSAVSSGTGTFSIAATNITVAQGSSGSSTITVTPAGGYTGTVEFTASTSSSNLANACYTVNNATVTGKADATATLTFDTNASDCASASIRKAKHLQRFAGTGVASNNNPPLSSGKTTSAAAIFAGLILAGFLGRYSKKMRVLAGLVLLVTFGMAFSGCGGSSNNANSNPPKGTYTITLTGQDTAVATIPQATTTFTLTID